MKLHNKQIIYAPTDITTFIDSPFASWMDHASLKIPELKDKKTLAKKMKYLSEKGNDFEQETLENFQKTKDVFIVPEENAFKETIDAMARGHDVIYQAALKKDNFEGYADFLVKVKGKSNIGNHFYEVYDSKLSRLPKAKFIIQLICYDEMLKEIQGDVSKNIYVILGTGKTVSFETKKYYDYYETVKEQFINFHKDFDLSKKPIPNLDENFLAWEKEAKRFLHELSDLSLVSGISIDLIKKFRDIGINKMEELATCKHVDFLLPDVFERLKSQSEVQLRSRYGEEAQIKVVNFERTLQKGLSKLPNPSDFDIFLNIEESLLADQNGLVFHMGYLSNDYYISENNTSKTSEKMRFESFINKLEKIKFNKIYVYGNKTVEILKKLSAQYNSKTEFIFGLIYKHAFIDIKEIILQSVVIGVESYELRALRSFFPTLEIEDSNIILEDYEKSQSPKIKKMLLSKISKNSKQKTLAIRVLRDKLINVREEADIPFVDFRDTEEGIMYYQEKEEAEKLLAMEKEMGEDEPASLEPERKTFEAPAYDFEEYKNLEPNNRLNFLMKQLNNFYDTEDRPTGVERNAKFLGLESDWYDDLECLAFLKRVSQDEKKPQIFTFEFDPMQETKLRIGDSIKLFHNKKINGQIVDLSLEQGTIKISFTKRYVEYIQRKNSISIIGFNTIRKDALIKSIKNLLEHFDEQQENCGIPKALFDFLMKKHPDILGVKAGDDLYHEDEDLIKALTRNVLSMNNTTLVVQGPPGTGKTYTCSRVVKSLLEQGKKIAICSNSHKAINNLMAKIAEYVGDEYSLVKIESKDDPMFEGLSNVSILPDIKKLSKFRYNIFGATSFTLCKPDFIENFDYLLIDEAGQFSLANLTSIIPCAKNVVLIGDQAQLEQPISGIHAGESGLSCLEYYVGGTQTITKDYGFFLPMSRRMNPALGDVVSELFYEGRLQSYKDNEKRKLILKNNKIINKTEGLQFIASNHEGNIQSSVEEVNKIVKITQELLTQKIKLFDENGKIKTKQIEMSDIIYVSPYNLQVTRLKEALGDDANVGSVDLFQGQEAPIVIISLASSKGSSGRGLSFILNKNRMNVALSRGKVLAILVASPDIIKTKVKDIEDLELLDMFCKLIKY